ncbi:hypothetical protein [Rhabdothermincola salaria]|uniref:hypothetical protein n=1 Tax=Rhabdothermincola salaria TaxID=2903142 RepID=UPI001E39BE7A|nr:hypothetical protein [Rhabdothermincola salaria]MCD9624362.1 hypothetical protein [Rhabdothermincola salaria]
MNDLARLAGIFRVALGLAFVLALGGAFLPGRAGTASAVAALVVLAGAPVVRVAWLTIDWARTGDRRFALVGGALLVVLATGGIVALV